ncbi:MAG: hypothetical protein EB078_01420 [Proteobacteria bacterium]|nr:hypothetical protein [Pseudomonadota bacterium]
MKKWLVVLFGFGLMGIAEDHGTPSESPTASPRPVETPLSTPPVNVSQFLSQEVGKALIANQGDIKNTIKSLTGSTHEDAEQALAKALGIVNEQSRPGVTLVVEDKPALKGGEMKFIADVLSGAKLKENANLSEFLKDNPAIFCAFSQTPEGDFKRTCINVTELASKIMSRVSAGDISGISAAVSESVASEVYEEVIDFKKYEEVWAGKTPDEVYEWSLKKLDQIPIESKAITLVGNVLAMRNGFTKAIVDGDLDKAVEYEEKMKSYVWGNQNQEEVSVESNTDLVSRNIKVTGIGKNELQSRVQAAKKAPNPWWWWK